MIIEKKEVQITATFDKCESSMICNAMLKYWEDEKELTEEEKKKALDIHEIFNRELR